MKYKNHFEISIAKFTPYESLQAMEEQAFDWNLEESIYQTGKDLYNFDGMVEEAVEYIKKETSVYKLSKYNDEIEREVIRACADAFRDNYIHEAYLWLKDEIEDKIIEALQEYGIKEYQIGKIDYDTEDVKVYISKKEIDRIRKEEFDKTYTDDEVLSELSYNVVPSKVNMEFFDYYGTRGSCDNWMECFKDMEEISYTIKKENKFKQNRLKALIQNGVNINRRKELLNV